MKVDLDELERDASYAPAGRCPAERPLGMPPFPCAAVWLALIARIRELEQGIRDCDECRGPAPWQELLKILEKGTVLP